MQGIINRIAGRKKLSFSSVSVTYQSESGTWRGFVVPYDITYEGETREEVIQALKEMTASYVEGLHVYNNPSHLSALPLSYPEDQKKWSAIAIDLINKLVNSSQKVESPDYYAEAQLPA